MKIMYLGPDIKGIVRHNQIFTYYPEEIIKRATQKKPLAKNLFCEMENIVESKKELAIPGSFLNIAYIKTL